MLGLLESLKGFYYLIILISILSTVIFSLTTTSLAVIEKRKYLYISIGSLIFNIIYFILLDIFIVHYFQKDWFHSNIEYLTIVILIPAFISLLVFIIYLITSHVKIEEQLKHNIISTIFLVFMFTFLYTRDFDFLVLLPFLIAIFILIITIIVHIILIKRVHPVNNKG